jgi:hypothetical protein
MEEFAARHAGSGPVTLFSKPVDCRGRARLPCDVAGRSERLARWIARSGEPAHAACHCQSAQGAPSQIGPRWSATNPVQRAFKGAYSTAPGANRPWRKQALAQTGPGANRTWRKQDLAQTGPRRSRRPRPTPDPERRSPPHPRSHRNSAPKRTGRRAPSRTTRDDPTLGADAKCDLSWSASSLRH